jgi:hypothetical protein
MAEVRLSEANARLSAHGCGMDLGPFREFEGGELTFEAFTITDEEGKQHPMVSLSGSRGRTSRFAARSSSATTPSSVRSRRR